MCLNDVDVQMLADGHPLPEAAVHVRSCERCAARVAARQRLVANVIGSVRQLELSPMRAAAMKRQLRDSGRALSEPRSGESKGATTLRPERATRRTGWLAAGSAIAATLLLVAIVPRLNRTETLSASEILGRSHSALATNPAGIETLTYDLSLDGVFAQLLPVEQAGRFTVQEVTDHDHPGRFRILKLAPDGTPVAGAAEDPVAGQRVRYMRVNGRGYLLRFSAPAPLPLSLPTIKRAALQSFVLMMQGQPHAAVTEGWRDGERVFVVEIPAAGTFPAGAPFTLSRGRAVIAADDSRLVEVDAAGTIANQPFSVSFVLREHDVHGGDPLPGQFDIAPRPGDVVLDGSGSANPMWDVVTRALRASEDKDAAR